MHMSSGKVREIRQPLERVISDDPLPVSVDVVVVGAGIIGATTAWELSRRGAKVALLEKGVVGGEQSSRNWGWCRQQGRDPLELELARLSLAMWPALARGTKRDLGFRQCGVTFLSDNEEEIASWEVWIKEAQSKGVQSQLLSAVDARRLAPGGSSINWLAGLTTPSDGRAEPSRVAPFLAEAARELGASVTQSCAVREVERSGGQITAVVTEHGRIACSSVVVAGGAWTALFLRKMGIAFPQVYVHGSVARTGPVDVSLGNCVSTPYFSMRSREDSGLTIAKSGRGTVYVTPSVIRNARRFFPTYMLRRKSIKLRFTSQFWRELKWERAYLAKGISPFEHERILDPEPDQELLSNALMEVGQVFPSMANLSLDSSWGGVIDSTPDAIPVISDVAGIPGLFVASGFSGHGFGLGPAVGRVMADLATGEKPSVDLHAFRHSRMTDGSKLKPYLIF